MGNEYFLWNEEITDYFTDQNLSNDLLNKFIAMKNSGKIITIHRIGSSDITTEARYFAVYS